MSQNPNIQAFCCNCKEVTSHHHTQFGTDSARSKGLLNKFLKVFFESLIEAPNDDYKCSKCGTYLTTPDNLD